MGLFTRRRDRQQAHAGPLAAPVQGFAVIDVETTGLRPLDRIV